MITFPQTTAIQIQGAFSFSYHLFAQINALLVVVRRVESRDATNTLRAKASSCTVGTTSIKGNADDGTVVVAHRPGVLDVGGLQKSVDASEVGQLAA